MSKKEKIAEVAGQYPNLKEVWTALKEQGVVTIAYSTFCNVYREVFTDAPDTKPTSTVQPAEPAKQTVVSQAEPRTRKPIPAVTPPFKMATEAEVNKKW